MFEIVIAGMIGSLCGMALAMWEYRKEMRRLQAALGLIEARVTELEYERTRAITWAELIYELEMRVCDVQVSGISDVLQKLAEEQRDV
jgi:hypothetical protein